MRLQMRIEQTNNGWVLEYTGHDCLDKKVVCLKWADVLKQLDEYFGWWDVNDKWGKKPC